MVTFPRILNIFVQFGGRSSRDSRASSTDEDEKNTIRGYPKIRALIAGKVENVSKKENVAVFTNHQEKKQC